MYTDYRRDDQVKESTNGHERRKNATRALVLSAAGRLVDDSGADALSLDEIAASAGISRATLFNHFHSRDELLAELLSPVFDECLEALEALRAESSKVGCLETVARACVFMWERHRSAICRAESARTVSSVPALDRKHRALARLFAGLFRERSPGERFRLASPEASAMLAFRAFIPILDSLPSGPSRDALFRECLSGLLVDSGR